MSYRIGKIAFVLRGQAEVAVGFGVVGLQLDGPAIAGKRIIAPSLILEDIPKVEVGLGVVRL